MRFGCCVNLGSFVPQAAQEATASATAGAVFTALQFLKTVGFDFAECTVGLVMQPSADNFPDLHQAIEKSGLPVTTFNSFIPGRLALVGPGRDMQVLHEYVTEACIRIARLGGRIVVLGSGAARRVPNQYSRSVAQTELSEFLDMAGDVASAHGITIVLEPLCQAETNLVHTVQEAVDLVRRVGRGNVAGLADTYHMDAEGESVDVLVSLAKHLRHIHVADTGRRAPGTGSFNYKRLRDCLEQGGYQDAVSVECSWGNMETEAPTALATLKAAWKSAF